MSNLTNTFTNIADAIRAKTGSSETMTPAEMPTEIANIPSETTLIEKTITTNGTYNAEDDEADGYSSVEIAVPAPVLEDLTITANGEYTAPSGKAYGKVTANVPAPSNALFKQTLSGLPSPLATFTGADAPLDSLKASIEGVQDLHGYDSPWPAGGGKNKWEFDSSLSGDGNFLAGKTFTNQVPIGTYTLSCKGTFASSGAMAFKFVYADNTTKTVTLGYNVQSGTYYESAVFEKPVRALSYVYSNNANNNINSIQLEQGETASSYEPYENICPISGWSEANVNVTDDLTNPTYTHTYTIPFKDSNDNPITVYDGGIDVTGGSWTNNTLYEVFDNTATVTFGRSGQSNWYYQIVGTSTGTSGETAETISNMYSYANIGNDNDNIGIMKMPNGNIRVRVGGTQPATVDDFVNSLGVTPLQVVSKLATPQTGTFTPIALRSNGVTNISINCGEVTELKYYSDDILYNANNLQIANTSTYITANLNVALEVGKTYIGIIKDYGDWSNVPIIFTRVSGNQSITISLAQGSGTLVFTNNTVTLDPYAGDYRNIYLTLREYII